MRIWLAESFLFLVAGCTFAVPGPDDFALRPWPEVELLGTWKLVSVQNDTGELPDVGRTDLIITERTFDYLDTAGNLWPGTYTVDWSKEPPQIDVVTMTHTEIHGIFKIEHDKLTLSLDLQLTFDLNLRGSAPLVTVESTVRPTGFRRTLNPLSRNYGRFYTFVFQRESAATPRPRLSVSSSRPSEVPSKEAQ